MDHMSWQTFTAIPNGNRVFNHGYDQCVALANLYHEEEIGGSFVPVNSAYQWWTDFGRYPQLTSKYTQSTKPVAGAIFVSRYGIYDAPDGHIGVVTGVNPNGTFTTMEQNTGSHWPQRYVYRYTRNMDNILGFLEPKNNPSQEDIVTPQDKKDIAKLVVKELLATEIDQLGGYRGTKITLRQLWSRQSHQFGVLRSRASKIMKKLGIK